MALDVRQFASDVATITLNQGGAGSFGSGRLIAPGLVLTARHVVDVPESRPARTGWKVRLQRDRASAREWRCPPRDATVVWRGKGGGGQDGGGQDGGDQPLDLALLRLADAASPSLPLLFSSYLLVGKLDRTFATGFPQATWDEGGHAQDTTIEGRLAAPNERSLDWTVDHADVPDERDGWSGMSGAVLAHEAADGALHLFGAVQEVPAHFSSGKLKVARIADALADRDFATILEEALGEPASMTDYRPPGPAPATRWPSPLAGVVHLFDRRDPADWVAAQLGPGPIELVLAGFDDDMLDLFVQRLDERTLPRRDPQARPPAGTGEALAMRREVITIQWTGQPSPGARLRTGQFTLRRAFGIDGAEPDFAAAFRRALHRHDNPAWINLHIKAHEFDTGDVGPLQAWRQLWFDAARAGALPQCGVIYTVAGVAGPLPKPLTRALKPPGKTPLEVYRLPECELPMVGEWVHHLRDWRAPAPLQAAAHELSLRFSHDRFRLRALDHYLKTGTMHPSGPNGSA